MTTSPITDPRKEGFIRYEGKGDCQWEIVSDGQVWAYIEDNNGTWEVWKPTPSTRPDRMVLLGQGNTPQAAASVAFANTL